MKMKKVLLIILSLILFIGCEKETNPTIVGRWQRTHYYVDGVDSEVNVDVEFDFKADNTVFYTENEEVTLFYWLLDTNSNLVVDGVLYTINNLTNEELVLIKYTHSLDTIHEYHFTKL